MDDLIFEALRKEIDNQLEKTPKRFGIGLSPDVFSEFVRRGLITMQKFGAFGTTLMEEELPAYREKWFVFVHVDLSEKSYRLGGSETGNG